MNKNCAKHGHHASWCVTPIACEARRGQDEAFLRQVESLAGTARSATEEAQSYVVEIHDPELRKKAESLMRQLRRSVRETTEEGYEQPTKA